MNTTALAVIQADELDTIQRTAKLLAASGYFGTQDGITGMAQVAAKILAGRELGFGPFAAVNGIHIIQGKPTVGANLMAAAVRAHPRYDYKVKTLTDKICVLEFCDGGKVAGESSFTIEEAATAELSSGKNSQTWKKFPRNMLFARAMSNGVRWYAPDIFSGNAVYVPEELGANVDGDGNVIDTTYTVTRPSQEERQVDAEIADGDVLFAKPEPQTDKEHDTMSQWSSYQDARSWAVMVGACENEYEAKNSMKNVIRDSGLEVNDDNKPAILLLFLRHQNEKLAARVVA